MKLLLLSVVRAFLVAALVVATRAHAQPAPPDSPEKVKARALLKEGVRLLNAGQFAPALRKFEDAYAAFPSAKILVNIGTAQSGLGRPADAANTYQRYLDSAGDDAVQLPAVRAALADLDAKLGRLSVKLRGPTGASEVRIASGSWTQLSTSGLVRVAPGRFELQARAAGARETGTSGTIAAGEQREIVIDLTALESRNTAPPAIDRGERTGPPGSTLPGSRSAVGAAQPGSRSDAGATLPGSHSDAGATQPGSRSDAGATQLEGPRALSATRLDPVRDGTADPGAGSAASSFSGTAARPSIAASARAERWTPVRYGAIAAGVVGVTGIGAMAVLALRARSMWSDAQADGDSKLASRAATQANLATGAGVLGVAALAAGTVLWFVGAPRDHESTAVTAIVEGTQAGFAVSGRF